jgi:hypothetical protein
MAMQTNNYLIELHNIDEFSEVQKIPNGSITPLILSNIAKLDEANELEKALREIIKDPTETPHGPTEIADILTTQLHVCGEKCLAGFVIKGKSFPKVKSRDVTHQFAKLRTVPGIGLMILCAVGSIQDDAQRDFMQAAKDASCKCLIINAHHCAKLLIAYEKICPQDGAPFNADGLCREGHRLDEKIPLNMKVREKVRYNIVSHKDSSHVGAKRYYAKVIIDKHYTKETIKEAIFDITEKLKYSDYCRNEFVKSFWGTSPAHVVWLYIAHDFDDIVNCNWACQTSWIDPNLPEDNRPSSMVGNDSIGDIQISWYKDYEQMKEFISEHQKDKGKYLEQLQEIRNKAVDLGYKLKHLFVQYQNSIISEEVLISQIQKMEHGSDQISNLSSKLPFSPPDCKNYDQACQMMFLTVSNMFIYYSDRGIKIWSKENRDYLMQSTLRDFESDIQKIALHEKTIH